MRKYRKKRMCDVTFINSTKNKSNKIVNYFFVNSTSDDVVIIALIIMT